MMIIIKSKQSGGYIPRHDADIPMFRHCCNGYMEVRTIADFIPVFNAHGIQVMIQDETLTQSEGGES